MTGNCTIAISLCTLLFMILGSLAQLCLFKVCGSSGICMPCFEISICISPAPEPSCQLRANSTKKKTNKKNKKNSNKKPDSFKGCGRGSKCHSLQFPFEIFPKPHLKKVFGNHNFIFPEKHFENILVASDDWLEINSLSISSTEK